MCGIAGFFYKNGESNIPLGSRLSAMASVLGSRGLDGTGMALYGELPDGHLALRIHLESNNLYIEPGIEIDMSLFPSDFSANRFNNKNLFFGGVNAVMNSAAHADSRRNGYSLIE